MQSFVKAAADTRAVAWNSCNTTVLLTKWTAESSKCVFTACPSLHITKASSISRTTETLLQLFLAL
jgi:hypothetical protein